MSTATKNAAQNLYQKSIRLIAEIAAIVVSFFATGPIYKATVEFIVSFSQRQYGEGFEIIIEIFWFIIIGSSTYALARATFATLITLGGFALWNRLF